MSLIDSIWVDGQLAFPGNSSITVAAIDTSYYSQFEVDDGLLLMQYEGNFFPAISFANISPKPLIIDWPNAHFTGFDGVESKLDFGDYPGHVVDSVHPKWEATTLRPTQLSKKGYYYSHYGPFGPDSGECHLLYVTPSKDFHDSTAAIQAGQQYLGKVQYFDFPIVREQTTIYRFRVHISAIRVDIIPLPPG